jgi:hydrogenase small subunit
MRKPGSWFEMELEQRGVSRREFVEFCGVMATALALPRVFGSRIAEAVLKAEKPVIVWLEFRLCGEHRVVSQGHQADGG